MQPKPIAAIILMAISFQVAAEESKTTDGIDLSRLYSKFKTTLKKSSAVQIMNEDFNNAMQKNQPPKRLMTYAKKGDPKACNMIGYLFSEGKGVKKDMSKAAQWFAFCSKTNPMAAYNLGIMYAEGRGVGKDMSKAEPLLVSSWQQTKMYEGGVRLAYWYRQNEEFGKEWGLLQKLEKTDSFHKHCGYLMGEMILSKKSPSYDMKKASAVLGEAVNRWSPGAAILLSDYFGQGFGGEKKPLDACIYETISSKMTNQNISRRWRMNLEKAELSSCEQKAATWISSHNKPKDHEFFKLIY